MKAAMQVFAIRVVSRSVALFAIAALLLCASLCTSLCAQESPKPTPAPPIASHARLMAARSIHIEHAGSLLPNDVIGDAFQGWGHYILVADPAQADLIVSINAPVADSGVSVSAGDSRHGAPPSGGRIVASTDVTQISLFVLDAHDRVVLWSGSERPKSSMKQKQREDNIVETSLRLFRRFRNVIEPEPAP